MRIVLLVKASPLSGESVVALEDNPCEFTESNPIFTENGYQTQKIFFPVIK